MSGPIDTVEARGWPLPFPPRVVAGSLYSLVVVALAALAAWPIYRSGAFLILVAVAVVVATAIAIVARRWRWSGWWIAAALGGALLVGGVPLAVPGRLGGPSELVRGLGELLAGLVWGWKDLVTVELPVGSYRNLLVPALVIFLIGTCLLLLLSWRSTRIALCAVPTAVVMIFFGLAFGRTDVSASLRIGPIVLPGPVEMAIGMAGVLSTVLWLAWRHGDERRRALRRAAVSSGVRYSQRGSAAVRRRVALGVGMVAVAAVAAIAVVPVAAQSAAREVLRSTTGPDLDFASVVSPLAAYRANFDDAQAADVLFRVSGGALPERIRIATLDDYDGAVYRAGGDASGGRFIRVPSTRDAGAGASVEFEVAIEQLQGIWMPTAGRVASVEFAAAETDGDRASVLADGFYYNVEAQSGVQTGDGGLTEGDAYRVVAVVAEAGELAAASAPGGAARAVVAPKNMAAWIDAHATGSDGAALAELVALLRERSYLSHALAPDTGSEWISELGAGYVFQPSAAGHSLVRIDSLFERLLEREADPRAAASGNYVAAVGDDEQFAVATALMAEHLGFPARVVFGARLSSEDSTLATCTDGECRAADLAAWTEVRGDDGRWIPIDVTPQRETSPSLESTQQRDPENMTDVRPDAADEVVPPDPLQQDAPPEDPDDPPATADLAWLWNSLRIGGISLAVLALLLGPLLVIVVAKSTRRRGRRTRGAPADRIAGGWDELVDAAVDARRPVPATLTRTEIADAIATPNAAALAADADHAVFADGPLDASDAAGYWRSVEAERRTLRRSDGFWRRARAAVSLRSFAREIDPAPKRR